MKAIGIIAICLAMFPCLTAIGSEPQKFKSPSSPIYSIYPNYIFLDLWTGIIRIPPGPGDEIIKIFPKGKFNIYRTPLTAEFSPKTKLSGCWVQTADTIFLYKETVKNNLDYALIRNYGDELLLWFRVVPRFYIDDMPEHMYYIPGRELYSKTFWGKIYKGRDYNWRKKNTAAKKIISTGSESHDDRLQKLHILESLKLFYYEIKWMRTNPATPYYPWEAIKCNWQTGRFKIIEKTFDEEKGICASLILEKNGLYFNIVRPSLYRPVGDMLFYDKADEEALSSWMDSCKRGKKYNLKLMRPLYPVDSISDFKPLQTIPDSIFSADGEAYGYFFARPEK